MNILIIGNGGREHAIASVLNRDLKQGKLFLTPGNGGTAIDFINVDLMLEPPYKEVISFCEENEIKLVVVGPEQHLCEGIVDYLTTAGLLVFGPVKAGATLESSKIFAKQIMKEAGVPTATYELVESMQQAEQVIKGRDCDYVLKADGLCAGKGVIVPETEAESRAALQSFFVDKKFGSAGEKVVVEEKLYGQEVSVLGFCDGEDALLLPPSQDHKRAFDDDKGPNTGGMGVYTPVKFISEQDLVWIKKNIFLPILHTMKARGTPFKGILYAGLMVTPNNEIKVIEFNVRFGDPECQCVLPLLKSNLAELMLACVNGSLSEIKFEVEPRPACTVIMASGGYPEDYEKGKEIKGLEQVDRSSMVFHAGTKRNGEKLVTSGGRVLAVSTFANKDGGEEENLKEVIERCYQAVEKISFEGAFFRKDIGKKGL